MLSEFIRQEFTRNAYSKLAALVALPVLKHFKARVDPRRYNGAALLGLRGLVFKSHGSADAFAFEQALHRAYDAARNGLLERVHDAHPGNAAGPARARGRCAGPADSEPEPGRMTTSPPRYSRIAGTGSFLPPRRLSNDELARATRRAGRARPRTNGSSSAPASARATSPTTACPAATSRCMRRGRRLESAGCTAQDIDLIIVATSTPDMVFPSTACIVQNKLGIHGCAAFDVQAVCSGFIYALTVADSMIRTGAARKALVIGAEVFSRILDFKDRTTCVLFGDGAGAVVLEASDTPGILASELHADGRHVGILCVPGTVSGGQVLGDPLLKMNGPAVFKLAVGVLEDVARSVLAKAGRSEARHRLADPAPGQPAHHAEHGAQAEDADGQGDRHRRRARATPRRRRSRWRSTWRCAAAASPAATRCCSRAWAAASPGAPCCSTSEQRVRPINRTLR